MKEKVVHMVWVGDSVSPIEALCMKSFIANDMDIKLHAYNLLGGGTTRCRVM